MVEKQYVPTIHDAVQMAYNWYLMTGEKPNDEWIDKVNNLLKSGETK